MFRQSRRVNDNKKYTNRYVKRFNMLNPIKLDSVSESIRGNIEVLRDLLLNILVNKKKVQINELYGLFVNTNQYTEYEFDTAVNVLLSDPHINCEIMKSKMTKRTKVLLRHSDV